MDKRASRRSTVALAAAGALASTGTAVLGARNLLTGQADHARQVIPKAWAPPPRADGVYSRGGGPVRRFQRGDRVDLHVMLFGDSTAAGYGCRRTDELPGVLIARDLADRTSGRIRLSTKAIVGATSKGLCGQVDAMLVAGPPPEVAVILIGANDVTALNGIAASARRVGLVVQQLRDKGATVVVGTCPDFGVITAIPQPLRWVTRARGLQLARAQAAAITAAGGIAVPLAELLARRFVGAPHLLSEDRYHPSAAGYALIAAELRRAVRAAVTPPVALDPAPRRAPVAAVRPARHPLAGCPVASTSER
ncbi:SGNH/GDSL hydrolase family protein [Mycobacterium sp. 1274756.6]|uniref:SGNH/GDSL hydrolase family protein n=1 Tax=Mycobacterium sp. 1274756.6 TaxID=1834076 RepID=UPI0009EDAB19|nr:SGNH/GDSL hydrolase family protein [Mycobacterium sp. 1274756.6]